MKVPAPGALFVRKQIVPIGERATERVQLILVVESRPGLAGQGPAWQLTLLRDDGSTTIDFAHESTYGATWYVIDSKTP